MLISIETYGIYYFPGGVRTPYPSSGSAHAYDRSTCDIQEDRFSHAVVHFPSDNSKHDEMHLSVSTLNIQGF